MIWIEPTQAPSTKTEASVSILVEGAKRGAVAARAPAARDAVKASLESWADEDSQLTQNKFWRIYSQIQDLTFCGPNLENEWKLNFELPDPSDLSFVCTTNFDEWAKDYLTFCRSNLDQNRVDADAQHQSFVVDGLQRLRTISLLDFSQEISVKSARRAIKATLSAIENFSDVQSDNDLIALIGSTLSEKIAPSLRLVVRSHAVLTNRPCGDDTRYKVLNFSIHTGNSPPPAKSASRLAVGWALVNLITNARREGYATIPGQEVSRNLRNTICEQRARARFNRGTQNHADHGSSWQPTGYRHPRPHHSLARCA
jgi:hypothetical protein